MFGKATQDVTLETVGAEGASCQLILGRNTYVVHPPQTVTVSKNTAPGMTVHCFAPGNREKVVHYDHGREDAANANILNGYLPGMTYDTYTGAAYRLPERIVVDFSDVPMRPIKPPFYSYGREKKPLSEGIEDMGPDKAMLERERRAAFERVLNMESINPAAGPASGSSISSQEMPAISPGAAPKPAAEEMPERPDTRKAPDGNMSMRPLRIAPATMAPGLNAENAESGAVEIYPPFN